MKEQHDLSIARIKPHSQVWEPVSIDIRDLEAFREISESRKQRSTTNQKRCSLSSGVSKKEHII